MKHSRIIDGQRHIWMTERLWALSATLTPFEKLIDEIPEVEQDCWFGSGPNPTHPTIRVIAEHARRIRDADLHYPVILNADGQLMDGGHRIAKALSLSHTHITAVQFANTPVPDAIVEP